MHNNAPTHTAYDVRDALAEIEIKVMIWPPYSPDLNLIKNLWALLKAEIYKIRPDLIHIKNNGETKRILVETAQIAWQNIDIKYLEHLLETMPNRVEAIIKSQRVVYALLGVC